MEDLNISGHYTVEDSLLSPRYANTPDDDDALASSQKVKKSNLRAKYKSKKGGSNEAEEKNGDGEENKFTTIRGKEFKEAKAARTRLHEKTFRGWVNKTFAKQEKPVLEGSLLDAFTDGLRLIELVEVLTQEPFSQKYHTKPKMDVLKQENVALAVNKLKHWVAGLEVDAMEVTKGTAKEVLALVWQLIVRFQILSGEGWNDGKSNAANVMGKAREKVLNWWREQLEEEYEDIEIKDLDAFMDGRPILALMHKLDPSLIDYASVANENRKENLELGFKLAEEHLQIWPLLDAADMMAEDPSLRPDEQCILTYISEFPPAFNARFDSAAHKKRQEEELAAMRAAAEESLKRTQEELEKARMEAQMTEEELRAERERLLAEAQARADAAAAAAAEEIEKERDAINAQAEAVEQARLQEMEELREENEARIAALQAEKLDAESMTAEELEKAKEEQKAALALLEKEREELEKSMNDEIMRRKEAAVLEQQKYDERIAKEKEDLESVLKEAENQISAFKMEGLSELERLKKERAEMAAMVKKEMERLRKENELLRRGVEHTMKKKTFLGMTWCMKCKGFLWGNKGWQCNQRADGTGAKCKYTCCSKCLNSKQLPNNCVGGTQIDEKSALSQSQKDSILSPRLEDLTDMIADPTHVKEGILLHKNMSNGRWHKAFVMLKHGLLLVYDSEKARKKAPQKTKDLMVLKDSHLVRYMKESRPAAFGIENRSTVVWLDAKEKNEMTKWIKEVDECIVHSNQAADAEKRLASMFIQSAEQGSALRKDIAAMTTPRGPDVDAERERKMSDRKDTQAVLMSMVSPRDASAVPGTPLVSRRQDVQQEQEPSGQEEQKPEQEGEQEQEEHEHEVDDYDADEVDHVKEEEKMENDDDQKAAVEEQPAPEKDLAAEEDAPPPPEEVGKDAAAEEEAEEEDDAPPPSPEEVAEDVREEGEEDVPPPPPAGEEEEVIDW